MTAAAAICRPVPVEITPRAARDLHWLQKELGRRFVGWSETGDPIAGPVELVIRRSSGKTVAFFGTLEKAASAARAAVEAHGGEKR